MKKKKMLFFFFFFFSIITLEWSLWNISYGPRREKTCLRGFANNTGADQPAHPRSLISTFAIRFFGKYHMLTCYKWNFNFLASLCSWGDWFETRFFGNPEDRFSHDEAHMGAAKTLAPLTNWWPVFKNCVSGLSCQLTILFPTQYTTRATI